MSLHQTIDFLIDIVEALVDGFHRTVPGVEIEIALHLAQPDLQIAITHVQQTETPVDVADVGACLGHLLLHRRYLVWDRVTEELADGRRLLWNIFLDERHLILSSTLELASHCVLRM